VWLVLGLTLAGATVFFDYRTYERWAYVIYGVALLLLTAVFFVGATINNSRRWLDLGVFLLQPSELIKLAMIITTARFFADHPRNDGYSLLDLGKLFLLLGVPASLIMMQPDLGTSLVVIFITFTMILFQGVKLRSLLTLVTAGVIGAPIFWFFGIKDYQKERILSFLDLEGDSYGAGWQVRQSLIAFGSGGPMGKGYLQGTQVQKGFVPYHESDFAAVNWAEEHGFLGMVLLLLLYLALIGWGVRIARHARDRYGMMLAVGVVALLFWHVVINLGMVTGMLPVVGLTLPLISYGGSSFIITMLALGLLMNVSLRRHVF
jgi:rod shape determining protein RodA